MGETADDVAGVGAQRHAAEPGARGGRLNRPARAVIAVVEVVLAGVAVGFGVWLWKQGVVSIGYPVRGGPVLKSSRLLGSFAGGAIALVVLAGFLVLDALRQTLLAMRARPRRKEKRALAAWRTVEAEERAGEGDHTDRPDTLGP